MAIYRFQVTIPYFTGIPTDVITNDFHFSWSPGTPVDANYEDIRDRLVTFYNTIYSQAGLGDFMAPWVNPSGVNLKVYNVNDPPPRAPHYLSAMALTDNRVVGSIVTPETAVCLSFQGTPISGVPQARRRGRVFIGGVHEPFESGTTTSFPEVSSDLLSALATAGDDLRIGATTDGWTWVVYSRVLGTGAPVANGWIDNAPDTQRRRGNAPTARLVWP